MAGDPQAGRPRRRRSRDARASIVSCALAFAVVGLLPPRCAQAQSAPPWALDKAPSSARVYMDRSASMQGYERGPASALQALARELKTSIVARGLTDAGAMSAAGFGTTVDKPVEGASVTEALAWSADRRDTCLRLPLAEELAAYEASRRRAPRLMLVVTDGVASASAAGACGKLCPSADDATCLATGLHDYIAAGFSFFIVGVKLPFAGTFYPAQGGAVKLKTPVTRPLYVWIGSPSASLGREIARDVLAWAGSRKVEAAALDVWPGEWKGDALGPIPNAGTLALRRGELDVCARGATVMVDALPAGQPPSIRLKSTKPGPRHVWAARIPLVERSLSGASLTASMFSTTSRIALEGGKLDAWQADAKTSSALTCLAWTTPRASLRLVWTTAVSDAWQRTFASWSQAFGQGAAADPSRTEGLRDLLSLTSRLLARSAPGAETPLLDITVK